jgi:hypothetical protein
LLYQCRFPPLYYSEPIVTFDLEGPVSERSEVGDESERSERTSKQSSASAHVVTERSEV